MQRVRLMGMYVFKVVTRPGFLPQVHMGLIAAGSVVLVMVCEVLPEESQVGEDFFLLQETVSDGTGFSQAD